MFRLARSCSSLHFFLSFSLSTFATGWDYIHMNMTVSDAVSATITLLFMKQYGFKISCCHLLQNTVTKPRPSSERR